MCRIAQNDKLDCTCQNFDNANFVVMVWTLTLLTCRCWILTVMKYLEEQIKTVAAIEEWRCLIVPRLFGVAVASADREKPLYGDGKSLANLLWPVLSSSKKRHYYNYVPPPYLNKVNKKWNLKKMIHCLFSLWCSVGTGGIANRPQEARSNILHNIYCI